MKKTRPTATNDLRAEYRRSDFSQPLEKGKYAKRLREASNVVVLSPEVADQPTEQTEDGNESRRSVSIGDQRGLAQHGLERVAPRPKSRPSL
jgi:hypothetical protein